MDKKDTKQNQNSPMETTFSHKEMGKLRGLKLMDGKNRRNTKRERYKHKNIVGIFLRRKKKEK